MNNRRDDIDFFNKNNECDELELKTKSGYYLLGDEDRYNSNNDVYIDVLIPYDKQPAPRMKTLPLPQALFFNQIIPFLAYLPDLIALRCVNKEMNQIVDNLPVSQLAREIAQEFTAKKAEIQQTVDQARNAMPFISDSCSTWSVVAVSFFTLGSLITTLCANNDWVFGTYSHLNYENRTLIAVPGTPAHLGIFGAVGAVGVASTLGAVASRALYKHCLFSNIEKRKFNTEKNNMFAPLRKPITEEEVEQIMQKKAKPAT